MDDGQGMAFKYFLILLFSGFVVALGVHELAGSKWNLGGMWRAVPGGSPNRENRVAPERDVSSSAPSRSSSGIVRDLLGDSSPGGREEEVSGSPTRSSAKLNPLASLTAGLLEDTDKDGLNSVVDGAFDSPVPQAAASKESSAKPKPKATAKSTAKK